MIVRPDFWQLARHINHFEALDMTAKNFVASLVAATLLLGASASQASAALLFSGGEDIDFTCSLNAVSCGPTSNQNSYRTAWARESMGVPGSTADPPSSRFSTPVFSASPALWLHAQYCTSYGACDDNHTSVGAQMVRLIDSSGNPSLIIRGTGTDGQLVISSRTTAGVFTDLVTCPTAFAIALTQIDLYVNYGSSGEVTLYANSAQVCDFKGNVTNGDGSSTLNQAEFSSPFGGNYGSWSEVIIATTDTRAMARYSAITNGDGASVGFTGTNICSSIWNAIAFNDVNYGYTGASGVVHECTVSNAIPPGAYSVVGMGLSARALVGSTGPQHFDFITRVNGADYPSPDYSPTNSFSNFQNYIQTTNPATGGPWTISDFLAAGFNVGLESKP